MRKDIVRHGSLFSGIGGFDLAAEWMGWENVFHCEIEPFCRKVLKYHFPQSASHEDIRKTDFKKYKGKIDVLTGGFPCQPYSLAGKRLGENDERHLWPRMLGAIQQIRPQWIVGENVFGIVSWNEGVVFEEVHTDLENEGYEVQSYVLPAAAVGAPHRRDRVWFIAYSNSFGCMLEKPKTNQRKKHIKKGTEVRHHPEPVCEKQNTADAYSNQRPQRRLYTKKPQMAMGNTSKHNAWDSRNPWENFPSESPVCTGNDGFPDILDTITFSKWRTESIKAAGNAIVPQVAFRIFQTIQDVIEIYKKQ